MTDTHILLKQMIAYLDQEAGIQETTYDDGDDLATIWRGKINQRPAHPIDASYLKLEDAYLEQIRPEAITLEQLTATKHPRLFLYHGDLSRLAVDAIVNAANSELLGCFIPNHKCLDNHLHTFAGVRLRLACHTLMTEQSHKEPVGSVKVTDSYHLPARYIFHTVGPYIAPGQRVSPIRAQLLERSYRACLQEAENRQLNSLAFCCLSTGEFGFPSDLAAQIAMDTITNWCHEHTTPQHIIFCTYTEHDHLLYQERLL